jgi:hypothetical protein
MKYSGEGMGACLRWAESAFRTGAYRLARVLLELWKSSATVCSNV